MPIYEYRCTSCQQTHEADQRFTDPPLTTCPSCGGPLQKIFSAVGVVFKGTGFYKTDSRTTPMKAKGASTSEAGDSAGSTAKESTSTAPAPKTESAAPAASGGE